MDKSNTVVPIKERKTPTPHIDVFKADMQIAIPIDVMDMTSIRKASEFITKLIDLVKTEKGYAVVATKLGREQGTLFP